MDVSLHNKLDLIKLYVSKGDLEKSREQAEEVIQNYPEAPHGYFLMAWHYFFLKQKEDVFYWTEEALRIAPEDEGILGMAAVLYQEFQYDEGKTKEIIEAGLRLYPENDFFHAQFAQINERTNTEQALSSYREAIRLSPQNDEYLGNYSRLLYRLGKLKEAEKYEQLALQANPENTVFLLDFAWIAFQRRKYKKAQFLIDEAMRLEPNKPIIRDYYKKIYPTKNILVRTKVELNIILRELWNAPAYKIWELTGKKIPGAFISIIVMALELGGMYALLKNNLFIIIACYFLLLFSSSKITKSMLKTAGLTDAEETELKKNAKIAQQSALKEMKREIAKSKEQSNINKSQLSSIELETKLSKIWETEAIAPIIEQASETKEIRGTEAIAPIKEQASTKIETSDAPPVIKNETAALAMPKEYKNWPIYVMALGMVFSILVRYVPGMIEDANRPKPVSPEIQQSITEFQRQQLVDENKVWVKNNMPAVTQFTQSLREGNLADNMSIFVSKDYEPVIRENINHPLLKQLANAKIEKVDTESASSSFLLVNEQENVRAVVVVMFGKVKHIYGDTWSLSAKEKEDYQNRLKRIELIGKEMTAFQQ